MSPEDSNSSPESSPFVANRNISTIPSNIPNFPNHVYHHDSSTSFFHTVHNLQGNTKELYFTNRTSFSDNQTSNSQHSTFLDQQPQENNSYNKSEFEQNAKVSEIQKDDFSASSDTFVRDMNNQPIDPQGQEKKSHSSNQYFDNLGFKEDEHLFDNENNFLLENISQEKDDKQISLQQNSLTPKDDNMGLSKTLGPTISFNSPNTPTIQPEDRYASYFVYDIDGSLTLTNPFDQEPSTYTLPNGPLFLSNFDSNVCPNPSQQSHNLLPNEIADERDHSQVLEWQQITPQASEYTSQNSSDLSQDDKFSGIPEDGCYEPDKNLAETLSSLPSVLEPANPYFLPIKNQNPSFVEENHVFKEKISQHITRMATEQISVPWPLNMADNYSAFWRSIQPQNPRQESPFINESLPEVPLYFWNNHPNLSSLRTLTPSPKQLRKHSMPIDPSLNPKSPLASPMLSRSFHFSKNHEQDVTPHTLEGPLPKRTKSSKIHQKSTLNGYEFPSPIAFQNQFVPSIPPGHSLHSPIAYPTTTIQNSQHYHYHQNFEHPLVPKEYAKAFEEEESLDTPEPPFDANDTRPEARPRRQRTRYSGDLYTPKWVRLDGQAKEGYCEQCEPGKWLQLKNSAYWYHKQFYHGISSVSGKFFVPPLNTRSASPNSSFGMFSNNSTSNSNSNPSTEGLCHQCHQWVPLTSAKKKTTASSVLWFRHAHKCHVYIKPKNPPTRRK
ncbi:hypothetical protein G9A89_014753 [Geosiphon pyriformis]|nr:hypothetical protein G9A89_014753 [Geosiphon pyriformis]